MTQHPVATFFPFKFSLSLSFLFTENKHYLGKRKEGYQIVFEKMDEQIDILTYLQNQPSQPSSELYLPQPNPVATNRCLSPVFFFWAESTVCIAQPHSGSRTLGTPSWKWTIHVAEPLDGRGMGLLESDRAFSYACKGGVDERARGKQRIIGDCISDGRVRLVQVRVRILARRSGGRHG